MAVKNGFPDEALGELYPFEDRYHRLSDGTTLHYIDVGRSGLRRPTFLLLHGSPTWSFIWRKVVKPLSRIGRVIAIDHAGYGRSDHPRDGAYYSLSRHIANLEEFVLALNLKRTIPVVMDWGGPIGLGFAQRQPERIAGLVVMNTWAFTDHVRLKLPLWFKALRSKGVGDYLYGKHNLYVEKLIPRLVVETMDVAVMDGYRHPFPTPGSRAGIIAGVRMVPDRPSHPEWATMQSIQDGLPKMDVPALILWGVKDPAFSKRFAHAFHELLPQAESPRWFHDAGHFLPEDQPAAVAEAIAQWHKSL